MPTTKPGTQFAKQQKAVEMFTKDEWAMLAPRSSEWNEAWKRLAEATGDDDFVARNERSFEVWQYLGSARHAGVWGHEFRHRDHPLSDRKVVLSVGASPKWAPPSVTVAMWPAKRNGGSTR